MAEQAHLTVIWGESTKRWTLGIVAQTTDGIYRRTAIAEEPYGCPMTPETARAILDYAVMAMESQWPF